MTLRRNCASSTKRILMLCVPQAGMEISARSGRLTFADAIARPQLDMARCTSRSKGRVPEQLGCVDHYKELASEDASTCPPATCSNAEVGPKVEDVGSVDASQKCTLRIDYDLSCTKRSVEMKCSLR